LGLSDPMSRENQYFYRMLTTLLDPDWRYRYGQWSRMLVTGLQGKLGKQVGLYAGPILGVPDI